MMPNSKRRANISLFQDCKTLTASRVSDIAQPTTAQLSFPSPAALLGSYMQGQAGCLPPNVLMNVMLLSLCYHPSEGPAAVLHFHDTK